MNGNLEEARRVWGQWTDRPHLRQSQRDYHQRGVDAMVDVWLADRSASVGLLLVAARAKANTGWREDVRRKVREGRVAGPDRTVDGGYARVDWEDFIFSVPPAVRTYLEPDSTAKPPTKHLRRLALRVVYQFLGDARGGKTIGGRAK
jgi:hypothetical protein